MKEEQVILVNEKDEVLGYAPKMAAHEQALLHRAFSVFIFNDEGKLLLQQRAAHKYHSPRLWTNTVCSHQRQNETNIQAGKRRLQEEMGMTAELQNVFHFIYKAAFDNGLTEHELDHVLIGFSNKNPEINPDEVMDFRWADLTEVQKDIEKNPGLYTEWFKIIFRNSFDKLKEKLDGHFLQKPIKFKPVFKEKPWGGNKLHHLLNKPIPSDKTGESWELSNVPGNISVVSEGYFKDQTFQEILTSFQEKLTGKKIWEKYGTDFPLLIKYIDANDDLSIQVHPGDEMAKAEHNSFGKNELWHIIQANPGSVIYAGFKPGTNKSTYLKAVDEGNLNSLLRKIKVTAGDTIYIPSGTVHAIGKGVLLAEVQQTSDITYRIFDWNRKGLDGKPRELHTELAIKAIDFTAKPEIDHRKQFQTPYFQFEKLYIDASQNWDVSTLDSFIILMNPEGEFNINGSIVKKGESVLLPAVIQTINIEMIKPGKILKVYL